MNCRVSAVGEDKACGPDGLPAKLLKAGGVALAVAVNRIETQSIEKESVPARWKGGRLVDLYKKKGDASVCSNSRGLLISDHLSKAFVGKLLNSSKEEIDSTIPQDQYGGVSVGGTDLASIIIRLLFAYLIQLRRAPPSYVICLQCKCHTMLMRQPSVLT